MEQGPSCVWELSGARMDIRPGAVVRIGADAIRVSGPGRSGKFDAVKRRAYQFLARFHR